MKIAVAGTGYVGLSLAVLFAQKNEVVALDVDRVKVDLINHKISPVEDKDITDFLTTKDLNLVATLDKYAAYKDADFVIIATPTNFDVEKNYFDTKSIESVLGDVQKINSAAVIVIKSTIPIGFMQYIKLKFPNLTMMFSPEFLREGHALYDNLYPSRIIIGDKSEAAQLFAGLLVSCAIKENIEVVYTSDTEAESIKLFANTYLAMRVAFFNELDNYCMYHQLNAQEVIKGVSLDNRIGDIYNNPSFGYGGYCLPKDTKQLLVNYGEIPQALISAIVHSNQVRKEFIAEKILELNPKIVGVYRLIMKHGSDNFRDAAIIDVMKLLNGRGIKIIVFEPNLQHDNIAWFELESNLADFKSKADIILANRLSDDLSNVSDKVFTRDIFMRD